MATQTERKRWQGGQAGVIPDRKVVETGNFIYELGAHPGILTRVCTLGQKKHDMIDNLEFTTLENGTIPHYTEAVATSTVASTIITVEDGSWIIPESTLFSVDTNEQVLVTAVAVVGSSQSGYDVNKPNRRRLTVIRNWNEDSQFSAAAVVVGHRFQYSGPAMREGGKPADSVSTIIEPIKNTVRRLSHTFTMTDYLAMRKGGAFYGMSERERLERDMRYKAIWDEESMLLDGQYIHDYPGKTGTKEATLKSWRGSSRGLLPYIHAFAPGNVYDCNGVLSYRLLSDFFSFLTSQNPGGMQKMIKKQKSDTAAIKNNYIVLCGDTALTALSDLLHNKVQTDNGANYYGFDMQRIVTVYGNIYLRRHILLDGPRSDWMVFVDPMRIGMKTIKGFNNRFIPTSLPNVYEKAWDLQKWCGLWLANAELFGVLKGVQAAV